MYCLILGPCTRTLEAGELIWMTDRTPHESLPIPAAAASAGTRRQYFRLVVGQVSAWFADHSTPNPLGTVPPPEVRIVHGDKFTLYPTRLRSWSGGTPEKIHAARKLKELHDLMYEYDLGHMTKRAADYGLKSIEDVFTAWLRQTRNRDQFRVSWDIRYSADGNTELFPERGSHYYEQGRFADFLREVNVICDDLPFQSYLSSEDV